MGISRNAFGRSETHKQQRIYKMTKPTVNQIRESLALGPYFFSRDTLRFFGQTISSFKTEWHDSNIVRIYAPMKDSSGDRIGTTERFIKIENDKLIEVTV